MYRTFAHKRLAGELAITSTTTSGRRRLPARSGRSRLPCGPFNCRGQVLRIKVGVAQHLRDVRMPEQLAHDIEIRALLPDSATAKTQIYSQNLQNSALRERSTRDTEVHLFQFSASDHDCVRTLRITSIPTMSAGRALFVRITTPVRVFA